jgi:predicted CXXCH cytochrome family protein
MLAGALILLIGACRKVETSPEANSDSEVIAQAAAHPLLPSQAPAQTSESCRECHAEIFKAWQHTDHAKANQLVADADLPGAFEPTRTEYDGAVSTRVERRGDSYHMVTTEKNGDENDYEVKAVLGQKPSRQMLVETSPGRIQPVDLAWDPEAQEWFNVFGEEHRRSGEWGHWTGRGMNWNSMCAHCHMTGYQKNFDAQTDLYASTWVEQGISCIQCHGTVAPDHGTPAGLAKADRPESWIRDRAVAQETCAYCHARNETLTAEFPPGADYEDHFRLTLPTQEGVFWPDGQQQDEDFNWTSVKLSRMHHAGVSCMDCHDPHTNKTILPVENNALCMQCHSAPGRTMPLTSILAPVIDPLAHSRHLAGSTGNQCVSCHMPTTDYMIRSPRHDHGWLKPDPLLTKELGIPNACSRCHTEETVDWAIQHAEAWYGDKLDSRQRQRARAVAAGRIGSEESVDAILALLKDEDIPAWRATYIQLLSSHFHDAPVAAVVEESLEHEDPMVRSAAMQVLAGQPGKEALVRKGFDDPSRLVRFDARWALPQDPSASDELKREYQTYLELALDQPGGRLRMGQYLANIGRANEAAVELGIAVQWDRYSPGIYETQGLVLQAAGRMPEAATAFYRSAQLQPTSGDAMFRAGLAFAEAQRMEEAANALAIAVRRNPELDRAWYNLGLLQVQKGEIAAGLESLARAEQVAPTVPDYPYAAATVHWQQGDRDAARAAALRALVADPNYAPARQLLR